MYHRKLIDRLARRCTVISIGIATMIATALFASPAQAAGTTPPSGHFTATAADTGTVTLRGWAFDADDVNHKVIVSFSLDGQWLLATTADRFSAELAPYGLFYSGFSAAPRIPDGTHDICMFVQNVGTVTSTGDLLQCEKVTVNSQSPRGSIEPPRQAGQPVAIRGWVIDESNLYQSVDLFLTHNGNIVAMQRADRPSPQLTAYGVPGNHGFNFPLSATAYDEYCVFAVNIGKGYNTTIGCVDLT